MARGTVKLFFGLHSLAEAKESKSYKRSHSDASVRVPTCCWIAGGYGSHIPQSPLGSARKHNAKALLLFAWRKGVSPLVVLWGTLIVWRLFFWCADGAVSPPRAYFIPTKCGKITALHPSKAYWWLNKTVGIFAVPSMHHARSARLPYALHNDKEP